ncbi:MAG: hypothetical protein PUP92_31795 [Rhizonema sp. PD38]|nr:hypothetical protein [Rhizonema sp. PD38]
MTDVQADFTRDLVFLKVIKIKPALPELTPRYYKSFHLSPSQKISIFTPVSNFSSLATQMLNLAINHEKQPDE